MTPPPHINKFRIVNFGCCHDVSLPLTPLHALIGPNDSGKSSILRALQLSARSVSERGPPNKADPRLVQGTGEAVTHFILECDGDTLDLAGGVYQRLEPRQHPGLHAVLSGATFFRLEADALREPGALIPSDKPLEFATERGHGLASLVDALLSRSPQTFLDLSAEVARLFPALAQLTLENTSDNKKVLAAVLTGSGHKIGPGEMSEGLLYYIAFALLPHIFSSGLLLIEEPENGLHPARIRDVLSVLRAVSAKMQVIVSTHSPLVINELAGDEVTLLTRTTQAGTQATRLCDTFEYPQRSRFYSNGELWLAHCDGAAESALLLGPDRAA